MEPCQATTNNYDVGAARALLSDDERTETMRIALRQYRQALSTGKVTCAGDDCDVILSPADLFRCWFCGKYFCPKCANIHFGNRF